MTLSSEAGPAEGGDLIPAMVKWLLLCTVVTNLIMVHSAPWFIKLHPPAPVGYLKRLG